MTDQDTAGAGAPEESASIADRIEQWFARHFHNSIVSRDTELFNHVHAAKDDLVRLLSRGD